MCGDNNSAHDELRVASTRTRRGPSSYRWCHDKNLGCSFERKFTSLSANNHIHVSVMSARAAGDAYDPNRRPRFMIVPSGEGYSVLQLNLKHDIFLFISQPFLTPINTVS